MGAVLFVAWTVLVFLVGGVFGYDAKILPDDYERAKVACFELASGSSVKEFTRFEATCQNGATVSTVAEQ